MSQRCGWNLQEKSFGSTMLLVEDLVNRLRLEQFLPAMDVFFGDSEDPVVLLNAVAARLNILFLLVDDTTTKWPWQIIPQDPNWPQSILS
jgi:hypothetical protein